MADENALTEEAPEVEAPETPPAEDAEQPEPVDEGAEETEGAADVDETPDPAAMQAEIERLKKIQEKAKEDATYWRRQKAEARADYFKGREEPEKPEPQGPPPGVGAAPKVEDFEDYNEYVDALTDYKTEVKLAQWQQQQEQRERQRTQQERMQGLQTKLREGFEKYDDFEAVALDPTATHITPMVADILADCDHPADVAYYLAKNRVEGVAISRMSPIRAAREIAKIEYQLNSQQPAGAKPPGKKISKAPPPIKPVGSGPSAPEKDPEKMTLKEFAEWRESQGAKRY